MLKNKIFINKVRFNIGSRTVTNRAHNDSWNEQQTVYKEFQFLTSGQLAITEAQVNESMERTVSILAAMTELKERNPYQSLESVVRLITERICEDSGHEWANSNFDEVEFEPEICINKINKSILT